MSDGTKFGVATAKATERITFSDAETGEIKACVYPNELRVGLEDSRFRSTAHFRGQIIASRSIIFSDFTPTDTDNRLYNTGGTLYFNGSALGSGDKWTDAGTLLYPTDEEGVVLGGTSAATADILLHSDGGAIFNAQSNSQNFRVNSVNRIYALHVNGANDQVIILSGGAPASLDESAATDMAFFVSGTVGSKDTAVKGTSVFGGDVVISGSLHGGSPLQIGSYRTDLGSDVSFFVSGSGGSRGSSIIRGTSLFGGDVVVSGSVGAEGIIAFNEEYDNGNSSSSATIDWSSYQKQKITLTAATVTLTFTAPVGVGNFLLKVVQDGTGSRTVTWPAAVLWPGGSAPTLSTAASSVDIVSFYYDGSNYYGVASLAFA